MSCTGVPSVPSPQPVFVPKPYHRLPLTFSPFLLSILIPSSSLLHRCQPPHRHSLTEHSLIPFIRSLVGHHSLFTAPVGFGPSLNTPKHQHSRNRPFPHISNPSRLISYLRSVRYPHNGRHQDRPLCSGAARCLRRPSACAYGSRPV